MQGAIAQLGERLNGIQEVVGSIPTSSTIFQLMSGFESPRPVYLGMKLVSAIMDHGYGELP